MLLRIGFPSFDHFGHKLPARAFCLASEVQDFLPGRSFVDANGRPADTRVKVTRDAELRHYDST